MKVIHIIGGGDVGGAKTHVLSLIKTLNSYIDVKLVSLRPGAFADDAVAMGIDTVVIRSGNIFADIRKFIRIVKEDDYQVIHCHGSKANMFAVIAKRFTKLPLVTTVHSDYRLDYLHSAVRRYTIGIVNMIALRMIDYYVNVSRSLKETLIQRKFNPEKIFLLPNGIDFNRDIPLTSRSEFSKKHNLELKDSDKIVGIIARLTAVKGLGVFLEAAKEVLSQDPSVKFIIAGDGEERKTLERKAEALGITDNVHFLGYVNEPYQFMSIVDINTLTSISEGFPYVILEGAIMKKATVSSDVGGISDLIESGENGYLFEPGDYKKMAGYILELVKDDSKRIAMGEKMYKKAKEHFSLESMCKTQLGIYNRIIDVKGQSGTDSSKYDVMVSGYYGFRNIGDDAILSSIINRLASYRKDIRIIVLSKNPSETKRIYGVDSINRKNLFHILRAMSKTKMLIHGGGTLLQDNTSSRSLVYYTAILWLAKKMGLKTMVYANGVGPVNRRINRLLVRKVTNRVDIITLREEMSKQELDNLMIDKPKIMVTADPALAVETADPSEIDKIFKAEGIALEGPFIGFSARAWNGHEKYKEIIAKSADYMIEKYGVKPVFIPMQYPNDLKVIEEIVSKMKGKGYIIRNKYGDTGDNSVMGIISRMEMLIGMRLHSLIFAASLNIPVVGLVYETKVEGFMQYILQENASAGHIKNLDYDKLTKLIDDIWNRRQDIKMQLEKVMQDHKEKSLKNVELAIDLLEGK